MKKEVEYFFLISPPERIEDQITRFKKSCVKHVGSFYSMKSKAHISFGKFIDEEEQPGQMSDIMSQCLDLIEKGINKLPAFNLVIDGFNYFNHGQKFKSIYASIKLDNVTLAWFNTIKQQLLIDRDITPHITIARKIPLEAFNVLWPYFQRIEFKDSFKPEALTVLIRNFNQPYIPYQHYRDIQFAKPDSIVFHSFC
jgi:2'-5' RNA ligase